jgi:hypothetical protein
MAMLATVAWMAPYLANDWMMELVSVNLEMPAMMDFCDRELDQK